MTVSSRPASIADVARLAGVSVPTVSRVLTGAARVSPDKTARVEDAIRELEFRPNGAARALVSGNQNIIVVLTANTTYYGYAATIQGIEEAARATGMMVVIAVVESADEAHARSAVQLALSQPIAGIIVLKFDPAGVAALSLLPRGLPVAVASGKHEHEHSQALIDEADGGTMATDYLLSLGHATVHHVSIPPSVQGEDERTLGWRRALVAAGVEPPPVIMATWDPQSGYGIGLQLATRADVTAVLCGNDEIAMGVIRGATEAGRRVPEDLSIVGFDGHPLAALWSPSLTTVDQDFVALGQRTFALLQKGIAGDRTAVFDSEPTHLIVRESTAPPQPSAHHLIRSTQKAPVATG